MSDDVLEDLKQYMARGTMSYRHKEILQRALAEIERLRKALAEEAECSGHLLSRSNNDA